MKTVIRTYNPNSLTATGWRYVLAQNGSESLEFRNRWQGSRAEHRFTRRGAPVEQRPIDIAGVAEIGEEIERAQEPGCPPVRGQRYAGWRCASAGYVIR